MRILALTTATVGCLLVGVGGFGLYSTLTAWDILGRSGALMGLQPDHWRGHWLGTAIVYVVLGSHFSVLPWACGAARTAQLSRGASQSAYSQQFGLCCFFSIHFLTVFSRFRLARSPFSLLSASSVGFLFGVSSMRKRSNQSLQLTAGRCDDQLYFHETVLNIAKARSRQR